MYRSIHIYIYIFINNIYVYVYVCVCVSMSISMYMYMYVCICMCVYICIYIIVHLFSIFMSALSAVGSPRSGHPDDKDPSWPTLFVEVSGFKRVLIRFNKVGFNRVLKGL